MALNLGLDNSEGAVDAVASERKLGRIRAIVLVPSEAEKINLKLRKS